MKDYDRRGVLLASTLSGLAGYVDAVGFLMLGGFFVSFMSGNSTRLGVGVAMGNWTQAGTAFGLIVLFVFGVVLGATVARRVGEGRRSMVLATEAVLLIVAATLCSFSHRDLGMVAVVIAMGVENAVFQKNGDVRVGLTYMTGALVRMGQRLTTALHGGERWEWVPYLALWGGLACGGAIGAAMFLRYGVVALWLAAMLVVGLAIATAIAEGRNPAGPATLS